METLQFLLIEDNPGDFRLIEDYLQEEIEKPIIHHANSFAKAKEFLKSPPALDVILLDLTLPDVNGEELVNEIVKRAEEVPVIVLTGFSDKSFGIKTLSLGISDYLLKDDLNPLQLSRSIEYSIERKRIDKELKLAQEKNKIAEVTLLNITNQMAEYRLMALRSVMNPHFLFNCLNSIQYFIARNERKMALDYLSTFSVLIRKILDSSVSQNVVLTNEIEILKLYIELEVLRFDNKFDFTIEVDDEVDTDIEIPSLLIQPYVENAILHGLNNKQEGKGHLKIRLFYENEYLIFTVEDNGIGRGKAALIKQKNNIKEKSYGMLLTKERLEIINKTTDVSVRIEDLKDAQGDAKGTLVKIFIKIN